MISVPRFKKIVKRPHRIYCHEDIDDILIYLSNPLLPLGALAQISRDTGIPIQTLSDWRKHRTSPNESCWFPLESDHPNKRALRDIGEKKYL
jgi:hypothetical protein